MRLPIANLRLPIDRPPESRLRVCVAAGNNAMSEGKWLNSEGSCQFRRRYFGRKSSKMCENTLVLAGQQRVSARRTDSAFSLVEVLLVVTLLSLIVLALMAVFNGTQRAFRASVTQTDVLEGGRMAMDLVTADLRGMTPSYGVSNGPVNFMAGPTYFANSPLLQPMPGTFPVVSRTNALTYFFLLSRENTQWRGVGYAVNANDTGTLFPLYRYYNYTNITADPRVLFDTFTNILYYGRWTNNTMSRIIDGVVHLTVHAYDTNGMWMNAYYTNAPLFQTYPMVYGETPFYMFSNTVPAAVDIELGVLEDQTRARAESYSFFSLAQSNYLAGQSGTVHLFRQRVAIPNLDTSAYY
jgi:type II secretory pathway component PulJ